jgi:hypothetical protein
MFSNIFPKIVPFMRKCLKIWWSQRGGTQYGACVLHAGKVRLHAHKHTLALVHPHPHPHTRTCIHLPTHLTGFPRQQWFVNAHIAFLVIGKRGWYILLVYESLCVFCVWSAVWNRKQQWHTHTHKFINYCFLSLYHFSVSSCAAVPETFNFC